MFLFTFSMKEELLIEVKGAFLDASNTDTYFLTWQLVHFVRSQTEHLQFVYFSVYMLHINKNLLSLIKIFVLAAPFSLWDLVLEPGIEPSSSAMKMLEY